MLQVVKPAETDPLSVYFAGKMSNAWGGNDPWRYTLLPPWATKGVTPDTLSDLEIADIACGDVKIPCPLWSYAGPLYEASHGCVEADTQDIIFKRNLESIQECDLMFANITESRLNKSNALDCYGTLVEIGIAHALGKPVYIAFHYDLVLQLNEFWIMMKCAADTNTYKTDEDLVRVFIEFLKQETPRHRYQTTVSKPAAR
jgi:hypothetical protein